MTTNQLAIIDAAIEVAAHSKNHQWPQFLSPEFFDYSNKIDRLATAITAEYPSFSRNIRSATTPPSAQPENEDHEPLSSLLMEAVRHIEMARPNWRANQSRPDLEEFCAKARAAIRAARKQEDKPTA